ncbi:MAG: hypothetical protein HFG77_16710 [Hungatella sp.]|jgi:hypothetical protein|nr:hypothetical protein [Hungatella sp.]
MIYWQQTPFLAVIDGGGGVFLVKKEEEKIARGKGRRRHQAYTLKELYI